MLDYKAILVKRYALNLSGHQIARDLKCSKTGVNDFLRAFEKCKALTLPLPPDITNEGIYEAVYGGLPFLKGAHLAGYAMPDLDAVFEAMGRQNMTLKYQWGIYKNKCLASSLKPYSYRRFCLLYEEWCSDNEKTSHFDHVAGQTMEVDFAGKTFRMVDFSTGEVLTIVVFVAVLPYSQYVYAEGMVSTKQPQWIEANNNAVEFFHGVPQIVVCDNCKQAVLANVDWIAPELNEDYAEWAQYNGTAIMAAKVKKPKYKPSVEGAVGILEKGPFHDLEEIEWASLDDFNEALWRRVDALNDSPFEKKEHNRRYYFEEEKQWLLPLPKAKYQFAVRREATVSSDFHVRFDNAYYSCPAGQVHKKVLVKATASEVRIYDRMGSLLCAHQRATKKGQWVTDGSHLPANHNNYRDWSPDFFERKAALVGPYTSKTVAAILQSKKYQAQTFRLCRGVLALGEKYGNDALERACSEAVSVGRPSYNSVKNLIQSAEAQPMDTADRNRNSYIAEGICSDAEALVTKTAALLQAEGKGDE